MSIQRRMFAVVFTAVLIFATAFSSTAAADTVFTSPVFGFDAQPNGNFLVADAGAGVLQVNLQKGQSDLIASLPGVSDVAAVGSGSLFAITGGGEGDTAARLFMVSKGNMSQIADLGAFEAANDPDGAGVDSNPFDVAALSGSTALVADAGGNSILIAKKNGDIDWVATLPDQLASTDFLKQLAGCPDAPEELAFACGLPPMIPAQAVATSVAVGPDGAIYAGELTGFPFQPGISRVWRIEPGATHVRCGVDPQCTQVGGGFSAIIDLAFGPDGKLYVVEMDENGAAAVELVFFGVDALAGGTVNACTLAPFDCTVLAGGLTLPSAVTVDKKGAVYAVVESLMPSAHIVALP